MRNSKGSIITKKIYKSCSKLKNEFSLKISEIVILFISFRSSQLYEKYEKQLQLIQYQLE